MENDVLDDDLGRGMFTGNVEYAGFWVRFLAAFVDGLVFLPVIGLMFYNYITLKSLPFALIMIVLMMAYKPLMEFYYGATLGKMAMKIKVVSQDFEEITSNQALTRYIPWVISNIVNIGATILLFQAEAFLDAETYIDFTMAQQNEPSTFYGSLAGIIPTISALIMLFNDQNETGHDKMANTFCIRNK